MLSHKTSISRFQKTEIISSRFSDYNRKQEISIRRKAEKFTSTWKLNNIPLNNHWVKKEIKGDIKFLETNKNGNTIYQVNGMQ